MMAARAIIVLAAAAALLATPSSASAATNNLAALPPSPTAGGTSTTFVLRTAFDGRFEATSVTAAVAGRTLGMSLVGGTPLSGTWSVSTTLPAGTWQPTFTAAVAQGNAPSAIGAAMVVTAPAPAPAPPPPAPTPPPPTAASAPAGPVATPERDGTDGSAGAGPAQPTSGTSIGSPAPSPASAPAAAATPSDGDGPGSDDDQGTNAAGAPAEAGDPGEAPGEADAGEPRPSDAAGPPAAPNSMPAPAGSSTSSLAAPTDGSGSAATVGGQSTFEPDRPAGTMPIMGLVAVAGVALAGTMLLLAARRARRDPSSIPGAGTPGHGPGPDALAATLSARSVRRARTQFDEDPIVAALGIDDEASARRARVRAARANRDPGEPPLPR